MVLQLSTSLGVPLRQVNAMLRAAGHEPVYDESDDALPDTVTDALALLKDHQEPFPLIVVDRTYRVRDLNQGALGAARHDPGRRAPRTAATARTAVGSSA